VLDLYGNYIDNEGAEILSLGLYGNNTLREIYLGNRHVITTTGWQAGFNSFKCQNFRVEKSDLCDNCGGRTVSLSFKNALKNTNTMKTLILCNMGDSGTIATTICQL
jgi:Ran GTPase-activating protein (RanGAP) involved in mRNA processing and transport